MVKMLLYINYNVCRMHLLAYLHQQLRSNLLFIVIPISFKFLIIFLIIACMNNNCEFITTVHIQCIFYLVYVQTKFVCNYNVKVEVLLADELCS